MIKRIYLDMINKCTVNIQFVVFVLLDLIKDYISVEEKMLRVAVKRVVLS